MNKIRELVTITNKEHRGIIADNIVVTLSSIKFNGKPTRVSLGITGATFTTYG